MFTEEDLFIRKRWLRASVVNWLIVPFTFAFFPLVYLSKVPDSFLLVASVLGGLFQGFVFFATIYFFAYRRYGTRYLKFALIVGPLATLKNTAAALTESMDIWTVLFLTVELLPYVWWYTWSLKLKQVNDRKKAVC